MLRAFKTPSGTVRITLQMLLPAFLPAVFERLGDGLDADVSTLLESFVGHVSDWRDLRSDQTTLVHGDFRPDNFMFGVPARWLIRPKRGDALFTLMLGGGNARASMISNATVITLAS